MKFDKPLIVAVVGLVCVCAGLALAITVGFGVEVLRVEPRPASVEEPGNARKPGAEPTDAPTPCRGQSCDMAVVIFNETGHADWGSAYKEFLEERGIPVLGVAGAVPEGVRKRCFLAVSMILVPANSPLAEVYAARTGQDQEVWDQINAFEAKLGFEDGDTLHGESGTIQECTLLAEDWQVIEPYWAGATVAVVMYGSDENWHGSDVCWPWVLWKQECNPGFHDGSAMVVIMSVSAEPICGVYISESADDWGENWFDDGETIAYGETSEVFSLREGTYQLRFTDCSGNVIAEYEDRYMAGAITLPVVAQR